MALGVKSVHSAKVQRAWNDLISGKSEIEVLLDADISELAGEERVVGSHLCLQVRRGGGGAGRWWKVRHHSPPGRLGG